MKKLVSLLMAIIMIVPIFCFTGCGEPIECTIGEMAFALDNSFTQIEDKAEAVDYMVEGGSAETAKEFNEINLDLLVYKTDKQGFSVYTRQSPYLNKQIDAAVKSAFKGDVKKGYYFKDVKINGYKGLLGFEDVTANDTFQSCNLFIQKDGILYVFEADFYADSAKESMSSLIDSISFKEDSLKKFTVHSDDMTYKLTQNYFKLDSEDTDLMRNYKGYELNKNVRLEVESGYMLKSDIGGSLDTFIEILCSEYANSTVKTIKLNGKNVRIITCKYDGDYLYTVLIPHKEKIYMLATYSKSKSKKEFNKIIKTIKFVE